MAHGPPSSPPTVAGYKWKGCKGHFSCTGAVGSTACEAEPSVPVSILEWFVNGIRVFKC